MKTTGQIGTRTTVTLSEIMNHWEPTLSYRGLFAATQRYRAYCLILAVSVALSCRSAEPEVSDPGEVAAPVSQAETEAPKPPVSVPPVEPDPKQVRSPEEVGEPVVSLDQLLRLPEATREAYRQDQTLPAVPEPGEPAIESPQASRVELEVESRKDEAALRPASARTSTDVQVSVDVGNETRLRGGLRVEQESDSELKDPVPTLGIEKRF